MHIPSIFVGLSALASRFAAPPAPAPQADLHARQSAPNPIAALYPNSITGTVNSTITVLPIDYYLARAIIPKKWGILKRAYLGLLPGFPPDKYPVVVRAGIEHGDTIFNYHLTLPDWQNVHVYFPFVDILNDGYSSFIYNPFFIVDASNPTAINATAAYGTTPVPATFSPGTPYAYGRDATGKSVLKAYDAASGKILGATSFTDTKSIGPWPLKFYVNVTNQPTTGAGVICDNQIDLWNTTLTTGSNAPVGIAGSITTYGLPVSYGLPSIPALDKGYTFDGLRGVRADIAFIELPNIPCGDLKGYHGTGSGDS